MKDVAVCIYANEVEGPFSDNTARLTVVGQFRVPNVGSTDFTLEYVIGQIKNRTTAKFVAPVREELAKMGRESEELRSGDMIQLNGDGWTKGFSLLSPHRVREEYSSWNKLSTRRIAGLAACATLGVALATQVVAPAEAGAATSKQVVTYVQWHGVECLSYRWADRYSDVHQDLECNPVHRLVKEETAFSGDLVGIAPALSAQYYVACQIFVDHQLAHSDIATAEEGNEISCLRKLR